MTPEVIEIIANILTAVTLALIATAAITFGFGLGALLGVWWWILRPIRRRYRPYLPDAEYLKIKAMFDSLPVPRDEIPTTIRKSYF